MTALIYWRQRLIAGEPLHFQNTRKPGRDVRYYAGQEAGWPRAVRKNALYQDYEWWFENTYLKPFKGSGYFSDFEDKLPKCMDRLAFYAVMLPLVNPLGLEPRAYRTVVEVLHEGRYLTLKKRSNFYRLGTIMDHKVTFEMQTGMKVDQAIPTFDAEEIRILAASVGRAKPIDRRRHV